MQQLPRTQSTLSRAIVAASIAGLLLAAGTACALESAVYEPGYHVVQHGDARPGANWRIQLTVAPDNGTVTASGAITTPERVPSAIAVSILAGPFDVVGPRRTERAVDMGTAFDFELHTPASLGGPQTIQFLVEDTTGPRPVELGRISQDVEVVRHIEPAWQRPFGWLGNQLEKGVGQFIVATVAAGLALLLAKLRGWLPRIRARR